MGDHPAISGAFYRPPWTLSKHVSRGPPGLSGGPGPLGPHRNSTTANNIAVQKSPKRKLGEPRYVSSWLVQVDSDCRDARMVAIWLSRRRRRKSRKVATRRSRASRHSRSFSDSDVSLAVTVLRSDSAAIDDEDDRRWLSTLRRSASSCRRRCLSSFSSRAFCQWQVSHTASVTLN